METGEREKTEKRRKNAYFTVFMTMILAALLSLYFTLLDGCERAAIMMETEVYTDVSMNSALAEYHRELWNKYHLFAIEDSYGTGIAGTINLSEHLKFYLDKNMDYSDVLFADYLYRDFLQMKCTDISIDGMRLLTDQEGDVFRKRAAEVILADTGIEALKEIWNWAQTAKNTGFEKMDIEKELTNTNREITEKYQELQSMDSASEKQKQESENKQKQEQEEKEKRKNGKGKDDKGKADEGKADEGKTDEVKTESGKEEQGGNNQSAKRTYTNPLDEVMKTLELGILNNVVSHPDRISTITISTDLLISNRNEKHQISVGNIPLEDQEDWTDYAEILLFQEYLARYIPSYLDASKTGGNRDISTNDGKTNDGKTNDGKTNDGNGIDGTGTDRVATNSVLQYQLEYCLAGKDSDLANLKDIANRLMILRTALNLSFLATNKVKQMEITGVSTVIALALWMPELAEPIAAAISLGWAYMEALHDVKQLLDGGKVSLLKTPKTWYYGLQGMIGSILQGSELGENSGTEVEKETGNVTENTIEGESDDQGDSSSKESREMDYLDYLRIFLLLSDQKTITWRAMDVMEMSIRNTPGNQYFRLDSCIDCFQATVQISGANQYELSITREASYW